MQQQVPVSQQINQLTAQLSQAFVEREEAQAAVERADEKIKAIRNVLAGIQLGQELQKEIDAAQKPAEQPQQ